MSPRLGVLKRTVALLLLAAVAIWIAPSQPAWAAPPPYRATNGDGYDFPVRVQGQPTVWLHHDVGIPDVVGRAEAAIKICHKRNFDLAMAELDAYREVFGQAHDLALKKVEDTKKLIPFEERELAEAEAAWRSAPKGEAGKLYKAYLEAKARLETDKAYVNGGGAKEAEQHLQDANSTASVTIWLKQKWAACAKRATPAPPAPPPAKDGPAKCPTRNEVIDEINRARADPAGYAAAWPGADAETRAFLRGQKPVPALNESLALDDAAARHAKDQGATGFTGHVGSDGSKPMRRIQEAGLYSTITAEVISVGQPTARDVVRQLIVDRDSPTKAHRDDLFNPNLVLVGVGCAEEKKWGQIVVIDLSNRPMKRD